jgi:DNA-binding response OmpR family regulator
MNRLLLIDSNTERAATISEQLQLLGYTVERSACGVAGHNLALKGGFDFILLDLNVGGRDALLTCESLRAQYVTTPVIAFGEDLSEHTMQRALAVGVDVVLPHTHPATLLAARIKALLRRHTWLQGVYFQSHRLIKIGDLVINIERRTVERDGRRIELSDLEFSVLLALARSTGTVVRHGDLINQVWGKRAKEVYDEAVIAEIKHIRGRLEPNPSNPSDMRTEFGNGRMLAKPGILSDGDRRHPPRNGMMKSTTPPKAGNN